MSEEIEKIISNNCGMHDGAVLTKYITNLQIENKQLKELCNKYEEEHKTTFETWLKGQKVLTELEEWLKDMITPKPVAGGGIGFVQSINPELILKEIQELKEKYK